MKEIQLQMDDLECWIYPDHYNSKFDRLLVQYINASHLVFGQPQSRLTETVKKLLMHLLDEYMPTGILTLIQ